VEKRLPNRRPPAPGNGHPADYLEQRVVGQIEKIAN
jgi:hypothetical protein